jgi:hypothetical protein
MLRTAKSQQASAPQKLGATSVINPPWPEAALKTSVNDAKEPAPNQQQHRKTAGGMQSPHQPIRCTIRSNPLQKPIQK